jgi:hypothetical protein
VAAQRLGHVARSLMAHQIEMIPFNVPHTV